MLLLIETVTEQGTEWGVSFSGSNPEPKDYISCKSKEDAKRLLERLLHKHPSHKDLENAAQPLIDILYEFYCPHSYVVVSMTSVEVVSGEMMVPIEPRD